VSGEPGGLVRKLDAPEHERDALDECVRVDADPDPNLAHRPTFGL
jgi:hypothetical protein